MEKHDLLEKDYGELYTQGKANAIAYRKIAE